MIGMSSRSFTMSAPSKLMDLMLRALITTSLSASTGSVLSGGCNSQTRMDTARMFDITMAERRMTVLARVDILGQGYKLLIQTCLKLPFIK